MYSIDHLVDKKTKAQKDKRIKGQNETKGQKDKRIKG